MKELVSVELVERVFRYLAISGPIDGLAIGALVGWWLRAARIGLICGVIVACIGPANYGLWKLSGAITGKLGLDSVANLLIQAAMFVILGFAAGVILGGCRAKSGI